MSTATPSPVLAVGAGVAGAAAAILLARAGWPVTVLEKEAAAVDKMCGEFISVEAQRYFRLLGIDLAALGAVPIDNVAVTLETRTVAHALPFAALSLSRRMIDEALLQAAQRAGATVVRGARVTHVEEESSGDLTVVCERGTYHPSAVLLATGKHEMPGGKRKAAREVEPLIGFKMYFELSPAQRQALAGQIELFFFDGGYAGLQAVENGRANLCLLVHEKRFAQAGGRWLDLLGALMTETPRLARLLTDAITLLARPIAIYRVPYGFVHRPRKGDPAAIYRLGDQFAVTHSFTGDGMALALQSAATAARSIIAGADAAAYHRALASAVSGQVWRSMLLYRLACCRPVLRAVMAAGRWFPQILSAGAAWTRLPPALLEKSIASTAAIAAAGVPADTGFR